MKTPATLSNCALALASMTSCVPSGSNGYCGGSEYRATSRALEGDLRSMEDVVRTYQASNDQGALRVDLTVDDVEESFASAAPPCIRLARLASNLIVSDAHARDEECDEPSARSQVTYTVTWTPTDGAPEALHGEVAGIGEYRETTYLDDQPIDGNTLSVVGGSVRFDLFTEGGDPAELELRWFRDSDHPQASIGR